MRKRLAVVAVLPLLLAGCGGDKPAKAAPVSMTDLTNDMGCPSYEFSPDVVGVKSAASCELDGQEVWIYTYSTAAQQTAIHDVSRAGGGAWVAGPLFDVQAPTDELAQRIAEATGGKVE